MTSDLYIWILLLYQINLLLPFVSLQGLLLIKSAGFEQNNEIVKDNSKSET